MQILIVLLFIPVVAAGQEDSARVKPDSLSRNVYVLREVERDGIRLPEVEIKEVTIHPHMTRSERREYQQYTKLVANIKKVYPYALLVRTKLGEINEELEKLPDDMNRRKYLRGVEKEVFKEYSDDIEDMTISQGRLLIKLIDRETRNTSFVLIQDYRGKFSAAFWQGIARIFGTNLKDEYDPYGEDALIELIINEINAGRL
jgi:hypothetical protein